MLLPGPQVVGLRMRGGISGQGWVCSLPVHHAYTECQMGEKTQTVEIYLLLLWQLRQDGPTGRRSWAREAESMWFSCVVSWQLHRSNLKEMRALSSVMERTMWQSSLVHGTELACHTGAQRAGPELTRLKSLRPSPSDLCLAPRPPLVKVPHLLMAPPAFGKYSNTQACGAHVTRSLEPLSSIHKAFPWK